MPEEQHAHQMKQSFHLIAGFPGFIGCIDCVHIGISCSTDIRNAAAYMNRKGYYSLNVVMVYDAFMKVRNVVVRWQGSVHDSRVSTTVICVLDSETRHSEEFYLETMNMHEKDTF